MAEMLSILTVLLAGTTLAGKDVSNFGFLGFFPESCRSGHDNIADICGLRSFAQLAKTFGLARLRSGALRRSTVRLCSKLGLINLSR